jgi:hypothetical protein
MLLSGEPAEEAPLPLSDDRIQCSAYEDNRYRVTPRLFKMGELADSARPVASTAQRHSKA